MNITISNSTWGDVFVSSPGLIGCVYDLGLDIIVDFYSVINGTLRKKDSIIFNFTERILFARGDKNNLGNILVMGQGLTTGKFRLQSLGGDYNPPVPLTTYGTHICDLRPIPNDFHYVVQVGNTIYYDSMTEKTYPIPGLPTGTSQGIIQLFGTEIRWSDLWRTAIPEMLYPFFSGDIYIGEGRSDPAHIQALEGGIQKNIFNGVAERPRACYDESSNLFVTSSRSKAGVTFNFFNLPLPNLDVVVPPVPIPPNPEPTPEPGPIKTMEQAALDLWHRWTQKFTSPGNTDESARAYSIKFAEQCRFSLGDAWGTKSADPNRPISKDTVTKREGSKLTSYDLMLGVGTGNPQFNDNPPAIDTTGQTFHEVAAFDYLSAGNPNPNPNPTPIPTPIPGGIVKVEIVNIKELAEAIGEVLQRFS